MTLNEFRRRPLEFNQMTTFFCPPIFDFPPTSPGLDPPLYLSILLPYVHLSTYMNFQRKKWYV